MSCWSWPSWQCAAGGPWGRVGQACKLDAMLLLSSQGPSLPSSLRNRAATSPASYLWALQGPRSAKNKRWKQKKGRGRKNGRALTPWAVNHFTPFHHSLPTLIDTHQPLPHLHTHSLCQPLPIFPPSAFFITDSSASLHLSHMQNVEGRQSPSITLISW